MKYKKHKVLEADKFYYNIKGAMIRGYNEGGGIRRGDCYVDGTIRYTPTYNYINFGKCDRNGRGVG